LLALARGESSSHRLLVLLQEDCVRSPHEQFAQILVSALTVSVSFCLPPVDCSPGTTPSQPANPQPFFRAIPLPIAAIVAVAVSGPMPGDCD